MDKFSVKQLAEIAGVSVRTLHHYDELGLLKPVGRTESKYRYYGKDELLRLQQILLYKEMEIPLLQIKDILDDADFDLAKALTEHRKLLLQKKERMAGLISTVEKTIKQLKNKKMNYEDLYKGFSKEQAEAYQKEASERWGKDIVEDSHQRLIKMGPEKFEALKQLGDKITRELAELMGTPPNEKKVQDLIKQHYKMTAQYFDVTPEIYLNLGNMYVEDERFTAFYDKYKKGLAVFIRDGIREFVK